jgi:hypothetical protein
MAFGDYFGRDYADCRAKVLAAAAIANAKDEAIRHPLEGPAGEGLFTDCLWLGPEDAPKVLLLISGTHGVEGFCGSGAMVHGLASGLYAERPRDVAVLIVHAINPFGFAWIRRVNEDNVDLNRNFIDWSKAPPKNDDYDPIADAIAPAAISGPTFEAAEAKLADFVKRHGDQRLRAVVGAGQYKHPKGLFYGGAGPVWSHRTLLAIIERHLKGRRQVCAIDFHTGLGPHGYGELIGDLPEGSDAMRRAKAWFGESVTQPALGTSSSTVKDGLMEFGLMRAIGDAVLTHVALEYGTFDSSKGRIWLRRDNWLHAYSNMDHAEAKAIKAGLRRHFYPDTEEWKEMVLFRAGMVTRQAFRGLASL